MNRIRKIVLILLIGRILLIGTKDWQYMDYEPYPEISSYCSYWAYCSY